MRLLTKVFLAISVTAIVSALAIAWFVNNSTKSALESVIVSRQAELGIQLMDAIDRILSSYRASILNISEEEAIERVFGMASEGVEIDLESVTRRINELSSLTGPWDQLHIVDANGVIFASSRADSEGKDVTLFSEVAAAFLVAREGQVYHSDFLISEATGKPSVVFAAPIRDQERPHAPIVGVVIGHLAWPVISEVLTNFDQVTKVSLYTRNGILIATNQQDPPNLFGRGAGEPSDPGGEDDVALVPGILEWVTKSHSLTTRAASDGHLSYKGSGWELVIETPAHIAFESAASTTRNTAFTILGVVFCAVVVILLLLNNFFIRPIRTLTHVTNTIAEGDLGSRAQVHSEDEIGRLARSFNMMAEKLQTTYASMEKTIEEKTSVSTSTLRAIETKNKDLEQMQMATVNLLEDLEEEKRAVEQKVTERTADLEQEKAKLLQVTSNMKGGGILLNEKQEVIFANEAAYTFLGLTDSTAKNKNVLPALFDLFTGTDIQTYFKRSMGGETFHVPEIDGEGRVYEIFFHRLTSSERGSAGGYFILFFDITDAKLLERSKSELVAVASHQLRTPLTAMRGNVEMLIDESYGKLNKEQHELLDDIEMSTRRLIGMVNDMLDITKIEKGDLEMEPENINAHEMIDSVIADFGDYAKRHDFTISYHPEKKEPVVYADRVRVRQIFQNLIDNAIKYSRHPGKLDIAYSIGFKSQDRL